MFQLQPSEGAIPRPKVPAPERIGRAQHNLTIAIVGGMIMMLVAGVLYQGKYYQRQSFSGDVEAFPVRAKCTDIIQRSLGHVDKHVHLSLDEYKDMILQLQACNNSYPAVASGK